MNGYGVPTDVDVALDYLLQSARSGNPIARAYTYRFFDACKKRLPDDVPIVQWLESAALNGSRMAMQDLASLDLERAESTRLNLRHFLGGIGTGWYCEGQWLYGLSHSKLVHDVVDTDSLAAYGAISDIHVNLRGDGLLHAAAANNAFSLLVRLLEDYGVNVNECNPQGETALLCAARSGHPAMIRILLAHGASASIQAQDGETPLHWLISFSGQSVTEVGKDLIERGGAIVDVASHQNISHSAFPSSIDVDFQLPGTPLLWAARHNRPDVVSFLLSVGADPEARSPANPLWYPLIWAAGMHHCECLRLMLSHIQTRLQKINAPLSDYPLWSPLVHLAIHASDRFSMTIRNGAKYHTQLEATLRYLHDTFKNRYFVESQGYETVIGYAVQGAHDEAAAILLEIGWGIEAINRPNASHGRTPLLDAVRWNRRHMVRLLLAHGADPYAVARNPFDEDARNWGALHIFAEQTHNADLGVVSDLLGAGVPVDGAPDSDIETPFFVAVRRNAFHLADFLLVRGADINAMATRSALLTSGTRLTGLGHLIALNARHCSAALRYLLSYADMNATTPTPISTSTLTFTVAPSHGLTALHLVAALPHGLDLTYTSTSSFPSTTLNIPLSLSAADFDTETNRSIAHEVLDYFTAPQHLEARCTRGRTALHVAAAGGNVGVARELVSAGARRDALDGEGRTAGEIARHVFGKGRVAEELLGVLG